VHSRPLLRLHKLQQSPVRTPAQELWQSRQCVLPQQHQNTAYQFNTPTAAHALLQSECVQRMFPDIWNTIRRKCVWP
jgi:hypothetical protein